MLVLKGVLFIGTVFVTAHCNNTIPTTTTTIELKTENVNQTNKMGVVALSNAASDTAITIGLTNVSSVTPSNESKIINITRIPSEKRRTIVTINSPSVLRQRKRKRKGRKKINDPTLAEVESLLYEEYESDGTKIVEFMMYTMEDVSKFFSGYLHTEICHVRCAPTPAEIAREEEAKKAAAAEAAKAST